jgi:hypothetical protein
MAHICTHCKKSFLNKYNLNNHINTAKYCLKLRKISNNNYSVCNGCEKKFIVKSSFERHKNTCHKITEKQYENKIIEMKEQYTDEIQKLKDHIFMLESKLENIALKAVSRPTTVNNQNNQNDNRVQTVINNLLPITNEHLQEQAKFLTLDHIKQGSIGYSQYAMDYPLKDRIACTDFARRKVKYKNEDGQVITDPEMTTLLKKLFSAIQSENRNMCHEYSKKLQDLILNETKNASDDMDEKQAEILTTKNEEIMDIIFEICSQARQVNEISQGKKPELFYEIVRDICTRSTIQ